MKEFNWKIIFTFQVLLIVLVSGVLSFKMGLFEDFKSQFIHEAVAEEPVVLNNSNKVQKEVEKKDIKTTTPLNTTKIIDNSKNEKTVAKENAKSELVEKASLDDKAQDSLEEAKVFARKTDAEVKKIIDKYKDQISDSYIATVTSYNSESGQTDDSPCIAASGVDVCDRDVEDIVATNDLPFHTKILIPEYFGDRIFYVEDRMNKRYTGTDRLDVWMKKKVDSKNFGAKVLKIIVLK